MITGTGVLQVDAPIFLGLPGENKTMRSLDFDQLRWLARSMGGHNVLVSAHPDGGVRLSPWLTPESGAYIRLIDWIASKRAMDTRDLSPATMLDELGEILSGVGQPPVAGGPLP